MRPFAHPPRGFLSEPPRWDQRSRPTSSTLRFCRPALPVRPRTPFLAHAGKINVETRCTAPDSSGPGIPIAFAPFPASNGRPDHRASAVPPERFTYAIHPISVRSPAAFDYNRRWIIVPGSLCLAEACCSLQPLGTIAIMLPNGYGVKGFLSISSASICLVMIHLRALRTEKLVHKTAADVFVFSLRRATLYVSSI